MTNTKIKLNLDSLKSRKEWKRHKVKDGNNIYRILPPFGEASNGYPYRKWQIIWGLTDPESGRARPFASSLTSEKKCPVHEFVQELKKRAENMTSLMTAAGSSKEDIKARLAGLNELIGNIVPKTVYIYNAADRAGEVGLLELKSTAHKSMKAQMNQYIQDYNQDPTSLNSADDDSGVWFNVIRSNETGQFRDTVYEVKKVQTKVKTANGVPSFVDDRSPLPEAVTENYDNLAYDLSSIYQTKTYDELKEVLDANLPGIIELVPDADLSVDPSLNGPVMAKKAAPAPAQAAAAPLKTGTAKVALKLNDGDDDDDNTGNTSSNAGSQRSNQQAGSAPRANGLAGKATSNLAAAVVEDDIMAQADAILNS